MDKHLEDELEEIVIHAGDIIIDHITGYVGIILNRTRRIDIVEDDIYFWEIKWTSNFTNKRERGGAKEFLNISGFLEEATLKLSILIGAVELHSTHGDNSEK
tara:strand:+ start:683 stop:988 length:306 start_codon:yes stop_codon:yes gene_type:complete